MQEICKAISNNDENVQEDVMQCSPCVMQLDCNSFATSCNECHERSANHSLIKLLSLTHSRIKTHHFLLVLEVHDQG